MPDRYSVKPAYVLVTDRQIHYDWAAMRRSRSPLTIPGSRSGWPISALLSGGEVACVDLEGVLAPLTVACTLSPAEIEHPRRPLDAFDASRGRPPRRDGKLVQLPVAHTAPQILEQAKR